MRLKNKKTGEIGYLIVGRNSNHYIVATDEWDDCGRYTSLAELNAEWEDYEEPKTHWMIDTSVLEPVREIAGMPYEIDREIGNHFATKEEAEKAVEKLKAWKRLKDKGFRFTGLSNESICYEIKELSGDFALDLDLLFNGGEE